MQYHLPENYDTFNEARQSGFLRVKKIKENNGLVAGIFCTFTPLEILDAAGIIPVGLCGMSDETIPAAEAQLPKNLCPLIKSSYGFALTDKCPYTYFADLIVGETTCDGKKKMYEMLERMKDTYILHLPQRHDDHALDYWTEEIRRFIAYLEQKFSVKITEEGIRRAAVIRNAERQAKCRLMEMQKLDPPPVFGYQVYKALEGAGFIFDRQETIDLLTGFQESAVAKYQSGLLPVREGSKRILMTGCPMGGVLDKTVKAVEERGGVVVCFENCTGIKAAAPRVDTDAKDIVRAVSARYLQIGCSVMTPNTMRMEMLKDLVKEYQVDGVIEVDLQTCTPYAVESFSIRRLMGDAGLPYMVLETDYGKADSGQISTRIEAFLEML